MKIWTPATYLTALQVRFHIPSSRLRLTHLVEVDLFEQYLSQEDQELSVMSSMLQETQSHGHNQNESSDYGSNDEELEKWLMDAVQQMEHQTSSDPNPEPSLENHDMDTTMG